jgi:hypothetical protein
LGRAVDLLVESAKPTAAVDANPRALYTKMSWTSRIPRLSINSDG